MMLIACGSVPIVEDEVSLFYYRNFVFTGNLCLENPSLFLLFFFPVDHTFVHCLLILAFRVYAAPCSDEYMKS